KAPAQLASHHPKHLTARWDLDAHQLPGREREADVVRHRRQIVGAVRERDDLVVVPVLPQLLETGVEIAEMGDHANYGLAVELDHEPQHTVGGGVLRPEVDQHVLARKVRLRQRDVAGAGSGRYTERHADRLTPGV